MPLCGLTLAMGDLGFLWWVGSALCKRAWNAWERIRFHVLYHAVSCQRSTTFRHLPLSPPLRSLEKRGAAWKSKGPLQNFGAVPYQPSKLLGNPMASV